MNAGEMGCESENLIEMPQDRVKCRTSVNVVLDLWFP